MSHETILLYDLKIGLKLFALMSSITLYCQTKYNHFAGTIELRRGQVLLEPTVGRGACPSSLGAPHSQARNVGSGGTGYSGDPIVALQNAGISPLWGSPLGPIPPRGFAHELHPDMTPAIKLSSSPDYHKRLLRVLCGEVAMQPRIANTAGDNRAPICEF